MQVNAPYPFTWIENIRGLRAISRLVPYIYRLWSATGKTDLLHVMANSGWSWHLYAFPAVWIAKIRGVPVLIHYHGGEAEAFFKKSFDFIKPTMRAANTVVVPSDFLQLVFQKFGISATVVPNIVNIDRFSPKKKDVDGFHIIVTRNLEAVYDIKTALKAFKIVRERIPDARMTIAGSGPLLKDLQAYSEELYVSDSVSFTGLIENEKMQDLYQTADLMINPSLADNMPISILEALASGVPVVSTNVGGVPFLVENGKTALLVDPASPIAMADAVIRLSEDHDLAKRLSARGIERAKDFSWEKIRIRWVAIYDSMLADPFHKPS